MLVVEKIRGHVSEERFAGRRRETLTVAFTDAAKRRLRATSDAGTDVALDLERGSYLAHGAVLADDGERLIVVERKAEEMVVVRLALDAPAATLVEQALTLGNAFGNQHVVVEVVGGEIRVPITTSREIAIDTVRALGLERAEVSVGRFRPWEDRPPRVGAGHAHHAPTTVGA